MNLTEEQIKQFTEVSNQLIKWMCENVNPHTTIIVDCTGAVLYTGEIANATTEFIRD